YTAVTFNASGGIPPRTWTVVNPDRIPPGLALNSSTGVLSGTPTAAGVYTFTVQVSDAVSPQQTDSRDVTVRIGNALVIQDSSQLRDATVGVRYTQQFTITGGLGSKTCSMTGENSPPGITLNANTCTLDGTPTTAGNYSFRITAAD